MEAEAVTPTGMLLLALLVLFTGIDLAGFWVCREDDTPEAFIGEKRFLAIIDIGTLVVCWAFVVASMMEKGAI